MFLDKQIQLYSTETTFLKDVLNIQKQMREDSNNATTVKLEQFPQNNL